MKNRNTKSKFFEKEKKSLVVSRRLSVARRRGFSIGEVVISSFVLVVGIVAALSLVSRSLAESMDSRNAIIAAELAQRRRAGEECEG